jgi:hypothetical protein
MSRKLGLLFAAMVLSMGMLAGLAGSAGASVPLSNAANNATQCAAAGGQFTAGSPNTCVIPNDDVELAPNEAGQSGKFFVVSQTVSDTVVIGPPVKEVTGGEVTGATCTSPGGGELGEGAGANNPHCQIPE